MSDKKPEGNPEGSTNSVRRRSQMFEPKQNIEVQKEKITINKSNDISKKFEEALNLRKMDSMKRKEKFHDYNYEDFADSSIVKDNLSNIEKALENLNKNSKLKELNEKMLAQIYDDKSKRNALSVEEKIHLFDRKINNCEIKEKVILIISLKNPDSKCQYEIEVYDEDKNLIGKSKKTNSITLLNMETYFSFNKNQILTIIIKKYSNNQMIKKTEMKVPLNKILKGADEDNFEQKIKDFDNSESINIGYDSPESKEEEKYIKLHFETEDSNSKYLYYNSNISYAIQKDNQIYFKSANCHDSNIKQSDKIPLKLLKPKFDILFYNNDFVENKFTVSTDELEKGILRTIDFPDISKRIKFFSTQAEETSFIKLRKRGLNLEFSMAIDFTASNGPPKFDDNSLHKIKDGFVNNYEKAIRAFYNIISSYNKNDSYYVYGFGGDVNGEYSACFNLNEENKKIKGIENIVNTYKDALNRIELSAGTFFAPVINKINGIVKEENKKYNYHILLIISDGFFEDMEQIIDAVLESSKLAISIIIIGVGTTVITDMKRLNGEYGKLISSKGEVLEKDIIQYVHYNDYADNIQKLTDDVLKNIPAQISEYYEKK